jgi:hypothetical protein
MELDTPSVNKGPKNKVMMAKTKKISQLAIATLQVTKSNVLLSQRRLRVVPPGKRIIPTVIVHKIVHRKRWSIKRRIATNCAGEITRKKYSITL